MVPALILLLASPSWAAPSCVNHVAPRLSGDLFAPVECSSATLPAAALDEAPVEGSRKASLKDLAGTWTGQTEEGLGRYALRATLTVSWRGRAQGEATLMERQTHLMTAVSLTLSPAKGAGRYDAALSTRMLPGAVLKGTAVLGLAAPGSSARVLDAAFDNGARYRVELDPDGPDALDARVRFAVPGGPSRSFETRLTRAP